MIAADSRDNADSLAIGEDRSNWLRLVRNRRQRERYGRAHRRRGLASVDIGFQGNVISTTWFGNTVRTTDLSHAA